jgi:hypothetical protein
VATLIKRRYKRKADRLQAYATGGAVSADGAEVTPPPAAPPLEPEPPPSPEAGLAIARAIEAARQAEQMQHDPQFAIERAVNAIPGLTDHKRAYLREHPDYWVDPTLRPALGRHYQAGLAAGIPDDSPEMNQHISRSMDQELAARHNQRAAMPAPATLDFPAVGSSKPMRARSLPFSAPVSRDIPTASGQKVPDFRNMTLSPAEREIARNSFGPIKDASGNVRDLTNEEKEFRYAQNKALMLKRRADGTLNE